MANRYIPTKPATLEGDQQRLGVTDEQLDREIDPLQFPDIARHIGTTTKFEIAFGLDESSKKEIARTRTLEDNHEAGTIKMFQKWKTEKGNRNVTYRNLLRIVYDVERDADLGDKILRICSKGASGSSIGFPQLEEHYLEAGGSLSQQATGGEAAKDDLGDEREQRMNTSVEGQTSHKHYFCGNPKTPRIGQHDRPCPTPENVSFAQVEIGKLWGSNIDVLPVYIYKKDNLSQFGLNALNILGWANIWNTKNTIIPKFKLTGDKREAKIRVKFGNIDTEPWSKVGTDAGDVVDPDVPTMSLRLIKDDDNYNKHIVVHEFGHALGMAHEHQRSNFWLHAENLLDLNKMKKDVGVAMCNYEQAFGITECANSGTQNYDPDSVMHYWFKIEWIKDTKYRETDGITSSGELSEGQKAVLLGIHKRHYCLAEDPSTTDVNFLADCYRRKRDKRNTEAVNRPNENQQPQQSGPAMTTDAVANAGSIQEGPRQRQVIKQADIQGQPLPASIEHSPEKNKSTCSSNIFKIMPVLIIVFFVAVFGYFLLCR